MTAQNSGKGFLNAAARVGEALRACEALMAPQMDAGRKAGGWPPPAEKKGQQK